MISTFLTDIILKYTSGLYSSQNPLTLSAQNPCQKVTRVYTWCGRYLSTVRSVDIRRIGLPEDFKCQRK